MTNTSIDEVIRESIRQDRWRFGRRHGKVSMTSAAVRCVDLATSLVEREEQIAGVGLVSSMEGIPNWRRSIAPYAKAHNGRGILDLLLPPTWPATAV